MQNRTSFSEIYQIFLFFNSPSVLSLIHIWYIEWNLPLLCWLKSVRFFFFCFGFCKLYIIHKMCIRDSVQFRIAGSVNPRRFKSSTVSRCFCRLSAASRFSRAARWQSHSVGCRSCPCLLYTSHDGLDFSYPATSPGGIHQPRYFRQYL